MRDQLRYPVYANLSHLANEKKYIGFARDIDAANPGVYIGPEVMVGIFVETAIHLYRDWARKDKEIELNVKLVILGDVLSQTTDPDEEVEEYWNIKKTKQRELLEKKFEASWLRLTAE